jgi:hypothetical protein
MIDREYLSSILVWGVMIGCAVAIAFLVVPINRRRNVVYSMLGFMIPLSMLGFVDGVSKQLGLVPCSGVVVLMTVLFGALLVAFDSRFVSRLASADSLKQATEHPKRED